MCGTGRRGRWSGERAATLVIGPVFVHGIATRTLAGLRAHAERGLVDGWRIMSFDGGSEWLNGGEWR